MNTTWFRALLVVSFVLSIFSGFFDSLIADKELELVKEYADSLPTAGAVISANYILVAAIASSLFMLVAYTGLFFFWNPARYIFLVPFVLLAPLVPVLGFSISSGTEKLIVDISNILSGFILALVFASPLKEKFR